MIKTKFDKYFNKDLLDLIDKIYDDCKSKYNFDTNPIIDMYAISYDATTGKTYFVAPVISLKDIIKCFIAKDIYKSLNMFGCVSKDTIYKANNKTLDKYILNIGYSSIHFITSINTCIFTIDVTDDNNIDPILIAFNSFRNNYQVSNKTMDLISWKINFYGSIQPLYERFDGIIDLSETSKSSALFYFMLNNICGIDNLPKSIQEGINATDLNNMIHTKKEEEPKMIIPDTEVYNNTDDTKEEFNFKPGDLVIHKPTNNIFKIEDINVYDDETDDNNINPNIVLYYSIEFTADKINPNKVFLHKGFQHIMTRKRFMKEFINLNVKLGTE